MAGPRKDNIAHDLSQIIGERNPYTSQKRLNEVGDYIFSQFESLDLRLQKTQVPFERDLFSWNILGLQEGTDACKGTFILGAHYDSVIGTPGADDNASAVAALLEIARLLKDKKLRIPLLYAGFTLEEYGCVGSRHLIEKATASGQKFYGMISLEMVGYRVRKPGSQKYPPYISVENYPDTGDFIAIVGNEPSNELVRSLRGKMAETVPGLPIETLVVPGHGDQFLDVRLSDHSPFWDHGTPAVMITDTAFFRNPNYHQPSDTLETLDLDLIAETAHAVAGFLEHYLG